MDKITLASLLERLLDIGMLFILLLGVGFGVELPSQGFGTEH